MAQIEFTHNPFSGIPDAQVPNLIVPRFSLDFIASTIEKHHPVLIQLNGKKGRGKTTHLKWIQNNLKEYPLYLLEDKNEIEQLLHESSSVILVDGIQKLSFRQISILVKKNKTLIFTTHCSQRPLSLILRKKLVTVPFSKLDHNLLNKIIEKRIAYSNFRYGQELTPPDMGLITFFTKEKGDDIRGIINDLYDNYQGS